MLPPQGTFIDPFDKQVYSVKPHETLDDFTLRIKTSREIKKFPAFYPHELRALAIISLAENANKATLDKYFELKAMVPSVSEVVSLAKTIATQAATKNSVSYNNRQQRAEKCNLCVLHKKKAVVNSKVAHTIGKLAGLKEVLESEVEKNLGICGMCGCSLQKKVKFSTLSAIAEVAPEELSMVVSTYGSKAFDVCWILNEALNNGAIKNIVTSKMKAISPTAEALLTAYLLEKQQAAKNAPLNT